MMARHLATACLIYLSIVLQSSFAGDLALEDFRPWFPGIALVACVLLHNGVTSLLWSAVLGLTVDSLSTEPLGIHIAIATIISTGLLIAKQEFRFVGATLIGVFVLAATLIWRSLSGTILGFLDNQTINRHPLSMTALGDAIYSAMIAMSLLLFIHLLKSHLCRRDRTASPILTNRWSMLNR